MQHLIVKTGLGVTVAYVIDQLALEQDKDSIKSMLIDIFSSRFDQFKKRHGSKFGPTSLVAYYIVENEYPVGENDIHQYFRALANEVKISNGSLSIGSKEERKNFTIIEGYSRNENCKKRLLPKPANPSTSKENWRQARMRQIGRIQPQKRSAESQWQDYLKLKKQLNLKKPT